MTKFMLSFLIMIISIIMFFITHPMSMGICILSQTFILCILSGMLINSYWFSYILFLTFLGGLLILFVYISSIASNEIFKLNINWKILFIFLLMFTFMLIFLPKNLIYFNINFNYEMNNLFNFFLFFNNENSINLTKLYNNQNYFLMMMMIIYLFITLISVIKITNIFLGPLRSFFNK